MTLDDAIKKAGELNLRIAAPGEFAQKGISLRTGRSVDVLCRYTYSGNLVVRDDEGGRDVLAYYELALQKEGCGE